MTSGEGRASLSSDAPLCAARATVPAGRTATAQGKANAAQARWGAQGKAWVAERSGTGAPGEAREGKTKRREENA